MALAHRTAQAIAAGAGAIFRFTRQPVSRGSVAGVCEGDRVEGLAIAALAAGSRGARRGPSCGAPAAIRAGARGCAARSTLPVDGHRAKALNSDLWTDRLGDHLALLRGHQLDRCPQDVPRDDSTAKAFMQLLRVAGAAALSYFTFGAM